MSVTVVEFAGCKGTGDGNETTETKPRCECVNECEVTSFSTSISSVRLSANVILDAIQQNDSSNIERRFVAAQETLHRFQEPLMISTVKRLVAAVKMHSLMSYWIRVVITDPGTSWTNDVSKLLTSLGSMIRGHIADSIELVRTLDEVYSKDVKYLVAGLSSRLQECIGLIAEVQPVIVWAPFRSILEADIQRMQLLRRRLSDLDEMHAHFEDTLAKEKNPFPYLPNPLIDSCRKTYLDVMGSVIEWNVWLDAFISNSNDSTLGAFDMLSNRESFQNLTEFRDDMANVLQCLLSYEKNLDSFRAWLFTEKESTLKQDFNYEPPTTSVPRFTRDGDCLQAIAKGYIVNSLSKRDLATYWATNGSEVLASVNQVYSDIEQSLFAKVTNLLDAREKSMVSFYRGLLHHVATLERYMWDNSNKALERFMRRLSIWRVPIVNFQKSQVIYFALSHICVFRVLSCDRNDPNV